jgi:hypothetical protein
MVNNVWTYIPFGDVLYIRTIKYPGHDVYGIENNRGQVFILPCYAEEQLDIFYEWKENNLEEK